MNSPIKYLGGAQTIVRSIVPGGPVYSIVGQRYRFSDHDYLELTIRYAEPQRVQDGSGIPIQRRAPGQIALQNCTT